MTSLEPQTICCFDEPSIRPWQMQGIQKVFRPFHFFVTLFFLMLQPHAKIIQIHFCPHQSTLSTPSAFSILGFCHKLCIPGIGDFLSFFSADPFEFCQVEWGLSVDGHSQVSTEMLDWVQVRVLAGLIKYIPRCVPRSLLHYLGFLLGVSCLVKVNLRTALN